MSIPSEDRSWDDVVHHRIAQLCRDPAFRLPKRSMTVGLRFDVEDEFGEITEVNRTRLDVLVTEFDTLTALDVIQDWIDQLTFYKLRVHFRRAGEDARHDCDDGLRGEPTLADLKALFDEAGQPYNETIFADDFDLGADTELGLEWTDFALSSGAIVVPFPTSSKALDQAAPTEEQ